VGAAVTQGEYELLAALQSVQFDAPAALHVPLAQGRHAAADVEPVAPEKVFAAQGVQVDASAAALQEPAGQELQTEAEVAPVVTE
jgi:hypothetical protein